MGDKRDNSIEVADPFARQLLSRYLERRAQDLELLDRALTSQDFDAIGRTGHNLSGSGSAYGLDQVSQIGRGIERAAERADAEGIRRLIDDLESFVRTVKIF